MAHSNRQKLRDGRGGLTRNQARKAKNQSSSAGASQRLQDTARWVEENEKKRLEKDVKKITPIKTVRYSKSKNATRRRHSAYERLKLQLEKGMKPGKKPVSGIDIILDEADIKRIKSEIAILKTRI